MAVTDGTTALRRRLPVGDRVALGAVIALLVVLVLGSTGSGSETADRSMDFGAVWLLAVAAGFAVAGRRAPATGALGNLAVAMVWYQVGYTSALVNVPYLVAFYLLGDSGDRRRQLLVGGLALAATGAGVVTSDEPASAAAVAMGWTIVPILFGELTFNRRALLDELAVRAARAEAERDLEAERRVARARLEIARDLHDVLAHTVSVMTVQAAAGHDAIGRDPTAAEAALRTVSEAGRRATAEVQALVTVLRSDAGAVDTHPSPGLAQVPELVEAARGAGIHVALDLAVDGDVPEVAQLTAYRIVQESLTNVVRHASARSAVVTIRGGDAGLAVDVHDDGVGEAPEGEGYGLRGMRERVSSLSGSLSAGPDPAGGWRVTAHLPSARDGRW